MTDYFSELLAELGKEIHLPLAVDKSNACSIAMSPLTIQMELDSTQENLFLFAKILELPPGKFRENVLCEALKTNGGPDPRPGIFGYIALTNHLALYQMYPIAILDGQKLAGLLGSFYDLGSFWYSSIQRGQINGLNSSIGSSVKPPFGMKL